MKAGQWSVGRLLDTKETRRWPEHLRVRQQMIESQTVFEGFTAADEGRTRRRVADCRSPGEAQAIAALPDIVEAAREVLNTLERNGVIFNDWSDVKKLREAFNKLPEEARRG